MEPQQNSVDLDSLLNEAAGGEPVASTESTTTSTAVDDTAMTTDQTTTATESTETKEQLTATETKADGTKPAETKQVDQKQKTNPMKEVRDKLNSEQKAKEKIENAIQRFTDGDYDFKLKDFKTEDGKVDYDAFIKAMDEVDNKAKAESHGITPEMQAEIDRIEKEKIEIQKERLKVSMDRAISNLQIDQNLNGTDINQFFKDALAVQKNPYQWLAQGGSLQDLYYLIYREKLTSSAVSKAVADAKAQWESSSSKKAPTTNPASSSNTSSTQDGLSLSELLSMVK